MPAAICRSIRWLAACDKMPERAYVFCSGTQLSSARAMPRSTAPTMPAKAGRKFSSPIRASKTKAWNATSRPIGRPNAGASASRAPRAAGDQPLQSRTWSWSTRDASFTTRWMPARPGSRPTAAPAAWTPKATRIGPTAAKWSPAPGTTTLIPSRRTGTTSVTRISASRAAWTRGKTWLPEMFHLPEGWSNTTYALAFDPEVKGRVWGAFSGVPRHPQLQRHLRRPPARPGRRRRGLQRSLRHLDEAQAAGRAAGHVGRG